MSPRGPVAVALTYGFTSLGSHPAPSLRQQNIYFLLLFPHPGAISPMGAISRMITVQAVGMIVLSHVPRSALTRGFELSEMSAVVEAVVALVSLMHSSC